MSRQCERLMSYLDTYGSVTPIQALADLGIMRLAARIFELESRYAYPVNRETVWDVNRMGEKVHYTRYTRRCDDDGKELPGSSWI